MKLDDLPALAYVLFSGSMGALYMSGAIRVLRCFHLLVVLTEYTVMSFSPTNLFTSRALKINNTRYKTLGL